MKKSGESSTKRTKRKHATVHDLDAFNEAMAPPENTCCICFLNYSRARAPIVLCCNLHSVCAACFLKEKIHNTGSRSFLSRCPICRRESNLISKTHIQEIPVCGECQGTNSIRKNPCGAMFCSSCFGKKITDDWMFQCYACEKKHDLSIPSTIPILPSFDVPLREKYLKCNQCGSMGDLNCVYWIECTRRCLEKCTVCATCCYLKFRGGKSVVCKKCRIVSSPKPIENEIIKGFADWAGKIPEK